MDLNAIAGPGVAGGLLVLAIVNTMPENPPASIKEFPAWAYRWVHDAAKTFVSFRGPAPKPKE